MPISVHQCSIGRARVPGLNVGRGNEQSGFDRRAYGCDFFNVPESNAFGVAFRTRRGYDTFISNGCLGKERDSGPLAWK